MPFSSSFNPMSLTSTTNTSSFLIIMTLASFARIVPISSMEVAWLNVLKDSPSMVNAPPHVSQKKYGTGHIVSSGALVVEFGT